jgi:hypothetical protein
VEVLLPRLQDTTAAMELRPILLQNGNSSKGCAWFDIMPLTLSETMGSLLKRAQDDKNHGVFRYFTKEEIIDYNAEKKRLYIKFAKKGCLFEIIMFTPFSVKDVYKMTDDNPLCLRLYIMNKKAPDTVGDDDAAFFLIV